MSTFRQAFDRHTASFSSGGDPIEIKGHEEWLLIPAGTPAPGVFVKDGEEIGFWLLIGTHSVRKEQAVLQKSMGKRGAVKLSSAAAMIRDAIRATADYQEGDEDADLYQRAEYLNLTDREWLWEALSARGRNLVTRSYDKLAHPEDEDDEGNE